MTDPEICLRLKQVIQRGEGAWAAAVRGSWGHPVILTRDSLRRLHLPDHVRAPLPALPLLQLKESELQQLGVVPRVS